MAWGNARFCLRAAGSVFHQWGKLFCIHRRKSARSFSPMGFSTILRRLTGCRLMFRWSQRNRYQESSGQNNLLLGHYKRDKTSFIDSEMQLFGKYTSSDNRHALMISLFVRCSLQVFVDLFQRFIYCYKWFINISNWLTYNCLSRTSAVRTEGCGIR